MTKKQRDLNSIEVYDRLGWEKLHESGSQIVYECPFCGKKKMYVDPDTSKFDCKVCGEYGNNVSVLEKCWEKIYSEGIDRSQYRRLAKYRGLPVAAVESDDKLGYDHLNDLYVWIVRDSDGKFRSLRTFKLPSRKGKASVRNFAKCKLGIIGMEDLKDYPSAPVYVAAGEWDRIAIKYMLKMARKPGVVVALPGERNFPKADIDAFKNRDVVFLYDNDEPGREGSLKGYKSIRNVATLMYFLHWTQDRVEGYDSHDLVRDYIDDLSKAYEYILNNSKEVPLVDLPDDIKRVDGDDPRREDQENMAPMSPDKLHEEFDKWLKLDNHDIIDVTIASMISIFLPGNPLWVFVVAPPSGSKTETIMPASDWWRCHQVSSMTSRSLVSGFQMEGGVDPSLLAQLDGQRKVLAIKDLTPLLQSRPEERDEIFGILRDAYDGSCSRIFGNGVVREYTDLHFGVIAGVTPAIDVMNDAALGERFLKFRADKELDRHDDIERAIRAISNCGKEADLRESLRVACIRSLIRPFDIENVPQPEGEFAEFIASIAYITAQLRAVAPIEKGTDIQLVAPMAEAPPRLATQFVKFAQSLCLHFEEETLDTDRIRSLVRRIALHTPDSISTRITQALFFIFNDGWASVNRISEACGRINRETINKVISKLYRTGLIDKQRIDNITEYRYTDEFYDLLLETEFFTGIPKTDLYYSRKFHGTLEKMTVKADRKIKVKSERRVVIKKQPKKMKVRKLA